MDRPEQTILESFSSAFCGIGHVLGERNFTIQNIIGVIALSLSFTLNISGVRLFIIIFLIAFVLAAEITNSAVERALDIITTEHHPEIGRIKEMLAGAVLVCSVGAAIIGSLIFIEALLK